MAIVYIGLGTNLGKKKENLRQARELVRAKGIKIIKESSIEETEPVDYLKQPDFLNQIIKVETLLKPDDLLNELQEIENQMGREKKIDKGPRLIDLDILLYDNLIINSQRLKVPHPEIENRNFILKHLIELDRELKSPVSGRAYEEVYDGK